jgi:hypothetical protein
MGRILIRTDESDFSTYYKRLGQFAKLTISSTVKAPSACAAPRPSERLEAAWSNISHIGGKRPIKQGRKRFFNAALHALRTRVDRTFAWEDTFKWLLLRFECIQQRHCGMKLMAYTLINVREFCGA